MLLGVITLMNHSVLLQTIAFMDTIRDKVGEAQSGLIAMVTTPYSAGCVATATSPPIDVEDAFTLEKARPMLFSQRALDRDQLASPPSRRPAKIRVTRVLSRIIDPHRT